MVGQHFPHGENISLERTSHCLKLKRKQKVFKYLHDLIAVTGAPKLQEYS
jgi:hypothetical protein